MIRFAKACILRTFDRLGYVVVKENDFTRAAAELACSQRELAAERDTLVQTSAALAEVRRQSESVAHELKHVRGQLLEREEAALRDRLTTDPENADLLQRLCIVLTEQGQQLPLELEERTLAAHLKVQPDRADLRSKLVQVQHKLGKLSRDAQNELRLAEFRERGFLPPNLYVQISNHCNLRCAMCGHKSAIKDNAHMDRATFLRVLDQAQASKIDNLVFAAAFGETLLHPEALDYLRESKNRGFQVTVATNGNFLEAAQIEELASLNLHCIQYSFFGYDKSSYEKTYVRGDFEKASENLRLLKAAIVKARGQTQFMVNGINIKNDHEQSEKTRAFLLGLGVEEDEIRLSMPNNFAGQISPGGFANTINGKSYKSVDQLPRYICPQLLSTPGVLADGRVTACGCLDNNGSLAIGDIRKNTLPEIRLGERYQSMIRAFLDDDLSAFPMCAKCDVPYGNPDGSFNERPA
jgi:MoaA/NifB/PqqE/SkfB family radical SAM enzyme